MNKTSTSEETVSFFASRRKKKKNRISTSYVVENLSAVLSGPSKKHVNKNLTYSLFLMISDDGQIMRGSNYKPGTKMRFITFLLA